MNLINLCYFCGGKGLYSNLWLLSLFSVLNANEVWLARYDLLLKLPGLTQKQERGLFKTLTLRPSFQPRHSGLDTVLMGQGEGKAVWLWLSRGVYEGFVESSSCHAPHVTAKHICFCLVLLFMCQNWSIWDGPGEGSYLLNKWTRFNSNLSPDVHRTSIPWTYVLGSWTTPVFPPWLAPLDAQISGLHHIAWDPPSNVHLHVTKFSNLKG